MKRIPTLSEEEVHELRAALIDLASPSGQPLSLDGMLTRWSTLVTEVERGYGLTAYDYTNDLRIRDRLEDLLGRLGTQLRTKVASALRPLDDRFVRATEVASKPLSGRPHAWWQRIPRKRDPEFDETM